MTPRRKVHAVGSKETLGPIVLSELHKSGHSYFPVYEGKATNIVGILSIFGLTGSKLTVNTYDVMNQLLYYVNEEQSLGEALQVIIKTSQEVLIVINNNQEYVGIITARDLLKSLVGETITSEFDQYDNRELVAGIFLNSPEPTADLTELVEEHTDKNDS
jgi:CBS domain containing-hemolysin-like protein